MFNKPDSVLHKAVVAIHLCDIPANIGSERSVSILCLAPGGVCLNVTLLSQCVRSYRTFSPLLIAKTMSGIFL